MATCRRDCRGRMHQEKEEECATLKEAAAGLTGEQRAFLVSACSEWLTTWRAMVMKRLSPRRWEKFRHLQGRLDGAGCYRAVEQANRQRVVPLLRLLMPEEEEEEVLATASKLDANGFRLGGGDAASRSVYLLASMANHSCVANVRVMYGAIVPIVVNIALTIPTNIASVNLVISCNKFFISLTQH